MGLQFVVLQSCIAKLYCKVVLQSKSDATNRY